MTTIFSALLIIAIAISVTLIVMLLDNQFRRKREGKLSSAFQDAVAEFNFSISKMELLGHRIIAVDKKSNKLLFLAQKKHKYDGYLVDLSEIKTCAVQKKFQSNSTVYIKRIGADAFVDQLTLHLEYKNGAKPLELPFYQKGKDPAYEFESRSRQANEWQYMLSEMLRKTDPKPSVINGLKEHLLCNRELQWRQVF